MNLTAKVATRVPQGDVVSVDEPHAPGIPQLALSGTRGEAHNLMMRCIPCDFVIALLGHTIFLTRGMHTADVSLPLRSSSKLHRADGKKIPKRSCAHIDSVIEKETRGESGAYSINRSSTHPTCTIRQYKNEKKSRRSEIPRV